MASKMIWSDPRFAKKKLLIQFIFSYAILHHFFLLKSHVYSRFMSSQCLVRQALYDAKDKTYMPSMTHPSHDSVVVSLDVAPVVVCPEAVEGWVVASTSGTEMWIIAFQW